MKKIFIFIFTTLLLGAGCVGNEYIPANSTADANLGTKLSVVTVPVTKFYNGMDGFSLSISSGNRSTCIWTWAGGTGHVPDAQTTYANSATEKHSITFPYGVDFDYDFKVLCTDDFGNGYTGEFPK